MKGRSSSLLRSALPSRQEQKPLLGPTFSCNGKASRVPQAKRIEFEVDFRGPLSAYALDRSPMLDRLLLVVDRYHRHSSVHVVRAQTMASLGHQAPCPCYHHCPDGRIGGSSGAVKIRMGSNLIMRRRTWPRRATNVGRRASNPRRFLSSHGRGPADHHPTRQPRRGVTKKRLANEIVEHSDLRASQTHGLLEVVFQSELNDTGSRGSADLPIERAGQQRGRVSHVDVVEQVEELRPELEVGLSRRL